MCNADTVRDSYNQCHDQWAAYRKASRVNQCIVDFAALLHPGARCLDIGCGTGYPIDAYLVHEGFHVTGIDVSERMIESAKALLLPRASFSVQDILRYSPAETFDAVIAFDSLWHIAWDRQPELYGKIASLLRPGGYLFFTHGKQSGTVIGEMFGAKFYYSALDVSEVHRLLAENGFSIVSSTEDYREETTGHRELLIVARKVSG